MKKYVTSNYAQLFMLWVMGEKVCHLYNSEARFVDIRGAGRSAKASHGIQQSIV